MEELPDDFSPSEDEDGLGADGRVECHDGKAERSSSDQPSPPQHAIQCLICLDVPEAGTEVCTLRCGHQYCRSCIEQWWMMAERNTCPTCRKQHPSFRGAAYSTVSAEPIDNAAASAEVNSCILVTTTLAVAGGGPKTTAPPPATVPEVGLTLPAVGAMVQVLFKTLLVGEVVPMPDSDSVINGMRSSGTEFFFVRFEDGELWKIVVGKHRYTELPCDDSPTAKKSQKAKLPSPRPKKRSRNSELTSPPAACGSDMAAAC